METRKLIKVIQNDYDILLRVRKKVKGERYNCCCLTLENLVEHLGGEVIDEKIIIPIPSDEF